MEKKDSLYDLEDTIQRTNIRITRGTEEKVKEQGVEILFKEMVTKNIPNLGRHRHTDIQDHKAYKSPY